MPGAGYNHLSWTIFLYRCHLNFLLHSPPFPQPFRVLILQCYGAPADPGKLVRRTNQVLTTLFTMETLLKIYGFGVTVCIILCTYLQYIGIYILYIATIKLYMTIVGELCCQAFWSTRKAPLICMRISQTYTHHCHTVNFSV